MMDGKSYPLLADGPWAWNAAGTDVTFKLKKARSPGADGTPVTADDVALHLGLACQVHDGVGAADSAVH